MRKRASSLILILVFLIGLSLLLYPTVSNYWNSLHQTHAIASYTQEVSTMSAEMYNAILDRARAYNENISNRRSLYTLSGEERTEYEACLNLDSTGIMGYIEIPAIEVSLPIYHGTSDSVLNSAVGHLEWTSLPVGGEGTHCVLSGHRGLPSAKLFTNLDKLVEGDVFTIRVLDEILTYEVDQIRIVNPDETNELQMVEGEDYCTLVTCTPYGINTHRLLVRGHRIEGQTESQSIRVTADALQIEPVIVAPLLAIPILLLLLVLLLLPKPSNPSCGGKDHEEDM